MASKFIRLYYNGEVGWNSPISDVHSYLRIQQPLREWIDSLNPDTGKTNGELIIQAFDNRTAWRLGYLRKDEDDEFVVNESKDQKGKELSGAEPMPWPVQLHVEATQITRDILINQSTFVQGQSAAYNFNAPNNEKREDGFTFTGDIDYSLGFLLDGDSSSNPIAEAYSESQRTYDSNPEYEWAVKHEPVIRVWLWSKAFNELNYSNGWGKPFDKDTLMDITPFVMNVNTNVVKTGGTFSLTLAPVVGRIACTFDKDGKSVIGAGRWFIPEQDYDIWYDEKGVRNVTFRSGLNKVNGFEDMPVRSESPTFGKRFQGVQQDDRINVRDNPNAGDVLDEVGQQFYASDWIREDYFFTHVVSENDLIFISFARPSDDLKEENYREDFFLSVDMLQYKEWTMIGLVDSNSTSMTAETTDVSINISGRDCMKLLIEDGTFFFQKSFANPDNKDSAFNNTDLPKQGDDVNALNQVIDQSSVNGVNRLITTGMIETLFNQNSRNVGFVMNLLISQLANIEICPSAVFESYGDRRTKFQVEVAELVDENNDGDTNKNKDEALGGNFRDSKQGE